jgi:hypothetical protein
LIGKRGPRGVGGSSKPIRTKLKRRILMKKIIKYLAKKDES